MSQNIVETEHQSTVPIKGICDDFQNVAEIFAVNFDKYSIGSSLCVIMMGKLP